MIEDGKTDDIIQSDAAALDGATMPIVESSPGPKLTSK